MAERPAVNRLVVGSNPTRGAKPVVPLQLERCNLVKQGRTWLVAGGGPVALCLVGGCQRTAMSFFFEGYDVFLWYAVRTGSAIWV